MTRDVSNQHQKMLTAMLVGALFSGSSSLAQEPEAAAAVQELVPAVVRVTGYMRDATEGSEYRRFGESSGFFIDKAGILLTVYDIYVDPGKRILCEKFEIRHRDGRTTEARMLAVDPVLNLAVLKTDSEEPYPMIDMAVTPEISSGDRVWAIAGTTANEESPVFAGLLKAEDNSSVYAEGCGNELVDSYIEFPDYAYGGPLVSNSGDLIGINMPFARKEECEEEGQQEEHATPIAYLNGIYRLLMAQPTFEQKWLGFRVRHIGMDLAKTVRQVIDKNCGILVDFVWPEGPSGLADIRLGDILVMIDDEIIMTTTQFKSKLFHAETNTQFELKLIRDGVLLTKQVRVEKRPAWAAL